MKSFIFLSIGTVAMFVPIFIMMHIYGIKKWKSLPVSVLLTIVGTAGTYIWFFVESGWFGGRSFYGAVFLVPVVFLWVARWLHISYKQLMDLCGPAECLMLAIMKLMCLSDGCCSGRELFVNAEGIAVYFPSQIVEHINALIIFAVLMVMVFRKKNRGCIYPWYLTLYGATRFVLNFFRLDQAEFFFGMAAGNVWSLVAIVIGIFWLCICRKKDLTDNPME